MCELEEQLEMEIEEEQGEEIEEDKKIVVYEYSYEETKLDKLIIMEDKKYGKLSFNTFLIGFVLLLGGILLARIVVFFAGIMLVLSCLLAIVTIINHHNNVIIKKRLLGGEVKLVLNEDNFEFSAQYEKQYVSSIVNYEEINILTETDDIFSISTKDNLVYLIDKESLGEDVLSFKDKVLNNANIYNGMRINKRELSDGVYEYFEEGSKQLSKLQARNKASNSLLYVSLTFLLIVIVAVYLNVDFYWMLTFVPIGIIELIYLARINKKLPKKGRLHTENILTILLLVSSLFVGCVGLLIELLERV